MNRAVEYEYLIHSLEEISFRVFSAGVQPYLREYEASLWIIGAFYLNMKVLEVVRDSKLVTMF